MPASLLGKRQRVSSIAEESFPSTRSKRRRAGNTTPSIYQDDQNVSNPDASQDAGSSMELDDPFITRIARPKGAVRDKTAKLPSSKFKTVDSVSVQVTDENTPPVEFRTPAANRFKDALANPTPSTPKHRVRLGIKPLTPRTPRTSSTGVSQTQTVYATARNLFASSSGQRKLIGRDSERQQLRHFISTAVKNRVGGSTYVSGPPGTGKSALVEEVFTEFQSTTSIKIANINCVGIASTNDVYGKLVQEFSGSNSTSSPDQVVLSKLFVPRKKSAAMMYLVLLDEVDSLVDTECEVLYHLFEWALHRSSRLILIGIANALDLTDRFLPRLKERNLSPALLPFLPYTSAQIATIMTGMLQSTLREGSDTPADFVPFLHPAAIQLSSKKVASQTGDLRKAFNLARRAIDLIERETIEKATAACTPSPAKAPLLEISNHAISMPPTPPKSSPLKAVDLQRQGLPSSIYSLTPETAPRATVGHVARLASSIFNNGTNSRLPGLNLQQKAALCSLIAAEKCKMTKDPYRTPSKSASKNPTVKELYIQYATLCTQGDGILHPLKSTEFRDVIASLETLGLLHEAHGRGTSFLTPTKTPSRKDKNPDDKQLSSAVTEKEMIDCLKGPGSDLLKMLIYES